MIKSWLNATPLAGMNALTLVLSVGLIVLSIALLLLTRTRWGQAKPLTKCFALAMFAHVLFMIYAWSTRLVYDHSAGAGAGGTIQLRIVATETSTEESETQEREPWDKPASEEIAIPDLLTAPDREPTPVSPPSEPAPKLLPVPDLLPRDVQLATEPARARAIPDLIKPAVVADIKPTPIETADVTQPPDQESTRSNSEPSKTDSEEPTTPPPAIPPGPTTDTKIEVVNASPTPPSTTPETPNDPKPAPNPEPARAADGAAVPRQYQHRAAANRFEWALQLGGTPDTEAAVQAALSWLAANQSADGRWDADAYGAGREAKILGHDRGGAGAQADTGVTGLALLAFLASGQTHFKGEHRERVQKGLEFLLRNQRSDGSLAGQAEVFARTYCHGMATLALSEAFALTGDERIRPYLKRAVDYTINSQNGTTGGWRYNPGDTGDMSQFGWQLMALQSAELGGLTIPATTRGGMERFLDSVSSGKHRGLASYRPNERPSRTMTAEACACRLFLGQRDTASMREAADYICQELPSKDNENLYYWYYASVALFQIHDESWDRWNAAVQKQLLSTQVRDGKLAGSWHPDRVWGHYGGRIYSTSLAALCLEVYYRYLPIYSPDQARRTAP